MGKARARTHPEYDKFGNVITFKDARGRLKVRMKSITPTKTKLWEKSIALQALSAVRGVRPLLAGPIRLSFIFHLPMPGYVKKLVAKGERPMPAVKPDLSNYIKAVEDAIEGIYYENDSQITDYGKCLKRYSDDPRVEVWIEEFPFAQEIPKISVD